MRVGPARGLQLPDAVLEDLVVLGVEADPQAGLRDRVEGVEQHPVVRRRDLADRLAEEDLVAADAGLGERRDLVDVLLDDDREVRDVAVRLLLDEAASSARRRPAVAVGGFVFGMSQTRVTPPITAAVEPVV